MGNNNNGYNGNQTPDGLYEELAANIGTGIVRTPTTEPFPAWATSQEGNEVRRYQAIPDAEAMKKSSLFGLPLRSYLTGQMVEDSTIEDYVQQAISQIEHILDIYINPVIFSERHDYSREMQFYAFGVTKLHHSPVLNVLE